MIIEISLENGNKERINVRENEGKYFVSFLNREDVSEFEADIKECGEFYSMVIADKPYLFKFVEDGEFLQVSSNMHTSSVKAEKEEKRIRRELRESFSVKSNLLQTKIPGKIIKVMVKKGDEVKKGDDLLILEAMKMENRIFAQRDGKIKEVLVKENEVLSAGDKLLTFE